MAGVHVPELMVYQKCPTKTAKMFLILSICLWKPVLKMLKKILTELTVWVNYKIKKVEKELWEHNSAIYLIQIYRTKAYWQNKNLDDGVTIWFNK